MGKSRPIPTTLRCISRCLERATLEWIANAKKPGIRAKRVEETACLAADNIRANQWREER